MMNSTCKKIVYQIHYHLRLLLFPKVQAYLYCMGLLVFFEMRIWLSSPSGHLSNGRSSLFLFSSTILHRKSVIKYFYWKHLVYQKLHYVSVFLKNAIKIKLLSSCLNTFKSFLVNAFTGIREELLSKSTVWLEFIQRSKKSFTFPAW
jgi:hypothetical protein